MKRNRSQIEPRLEPSVESTYKKKRRTADNYVLLCAEHELGSEVCDNCENVMSASKANHVHCLMKLLHQCEKAENSTRNALFHAIGQGYVNCVRLLLDFDAGEVNSIQQSGIAPLHMSAGAGHVEIMRELINRGADVHMRLETDQLNPLHICASFGAVECLNLLLENGVDPLEQTSDSSMNALHFAAYHGHMECIKALLAHGCDINAVSLTSHRSVLHYSMCQGKFDCFNYLVEQGADLSLLDINGHSALLCAPLEEHSLQFNSKEYFSFSERRKWFTFAILDEEKPSKVFTTKREDESLDSENSGKSSSLLSSLPSIFQEIRSSLAGYASVIFERLPIFEFTFSDEIGRGIGVMREWFSRLESLLVKFPIFQDCNNLGTSYFKKDPSFLNSSSSTYSQTMRKINAFVSSNNTCNSDWLSDLLLTSSIAGTIFAVAFIYGHALPVKLPQHVYKMILGQDVDPSDVQFIDSDFYHKKVKYLMTCTAEELEEHELYFSEIEQVDGKSIEVELKEGGSSCLVTKTNLNEYISLLSNHKLFWGRKTILNAFIDAFHYIIPQSLIAPIFSLEEISSALVGEQLISVDDWKANTKYENCTSNTKTIKFFWEALTSFTQRQKEDLLSFCTGAKHLPLGGFSRLAENPINAPFTLVFQNSLPEGTLPTARTCFNTLVLPKIKTLQSLQSSLKLVLSAQNAGVGFSFV